MKQIKTIERRISRHYELIEKFRNDNTLDKEQKKRAIFKLQMLIRELKWILNLFSNSYSEKEMGIKTL